MTRRDLAELLLLASLWGGSFLFMRLGAADFGPAALVFVRVAGAALLLVPLAALRGEAGAIARHWRPIAVVGLLNSALPFGCYMVAALVLSAGLSSIFNATTPLWAALIAWGWLGDRLSRPRIAGLAIGFGGVLAVGLQNASLKPGEHGVSPALGIALCLAATLCYGIAASYTKKRLAGVPPMAVAGGSQLAAAAFTLLPALWWWPAQTPGLAAWGGAAVLAFACTGFAYWLFFRLVAHAGPANAVSVTFLVPAFAVLWGWLFLGESLSPATVAGCVVVLLGTALATGVLPRRRA
ncbi:DMT family transporter [Rubrivivax gelatinosus]|uniref:EamA family transporter n=1 Tax=Rubrivivax gelatinosus TaxID=28068 RepID=A0ABS1DTU9_RUBGE|nr:DMT family transporter [Rubrivivax gelatinosus]MBK1712893.1 EamA family transporter [Rubrivivax gelatinosus]